MSKFIARYEFEIECGDLPASAVAEWLLIADKDKADYNFWELSNPKLLTVEVLDA